MSHIFEKIYYECRLKPLFEQVLREMAALTTSQFEDALILKINYSVENNEMINSNMTEETLSNSIRQILNEIFTNNNKVNDLTKYSLFAVYDDSNNIMVFNGNTNHFNRMTR